MKPVIKKLCRVCWSEKRVKIIRKYRITTSDCHTEYDELRLEYRILPHQRGRGTCSGSNKINYDILEVDGEPMP